MIKSEKIVQFFFTKNIFVSSFPDFGTTLIYICYYIYLVAKLPETFVSGSEFVSVIFRIFDI